MRNFLFTLSLLFLASNTFAANGEYSPIKLLPFDNRNENHFQVAKLTCYLYAGTKGSRVFGKNRMCYYKCIGRSDAVRILEIYALCPNIIEE
jgi:hypothetical protein